MEKYIKMIDMSLLEIKAILDFSLFQMNEQTIKGNDTGLEFWSNIYYKCRLEMVKRVEKIKF